ncbi:MAG: TetR/AcrR family transcriptional regulator [Candidatus Zixiibacteriota bacterium]
MVSQVNMKTGRANQKLRTRNALVAAAWQLLREGKQPTIDEVADAAMISRATAYRYFPNRERLLIEAVLSRESVPAEKVLAQTNPNSPSERSVRAQQYIYDQIIKNETLYRSLLRACQEEWMTHKDRFVLRGDQRLELIDEALRPIQGKISDDEFKKLGFALAAMTSIESYVALRDVCQLTKRQSREVMSWAIAKLVEAVVSKGDR